MLVSVDHRNLSFVSPSRTAGSCSVPLALIKGNQIDREGLLGANLAADVKQLVDVLCLISHHPVGVAVTSEWTVLKTDSIESICGEKRCKDGLVEVA